MIQNFGDQFVKDKNKTIRIKMKIIQTYKGVIHPILSELH